MPVCRGQARAFPSRIETGIFPSVAQDKRRVALENIFRHHMMHFAGLGEELCGADPLTDLMEGFSCRDINDPRTWRLANLQKVRTRRPVRLSSLIDRPIDRTRLEVFGSEIAYDGPAMARRLTAAMCLATLLHVGSAARAAEPATRARAIKVQTSIRGATQMFAAPWGLVAQGSGQLRILPLGTSTWQTVHERDRREPLSDRV